MLGKMSAVNCMRDRCKHPAKWRVEGLLLCGVHTQPKNRVVENSISGTMPKPKAKSSAGTISDPEILKKVSKSKAAESGAKPAAKTSVGTTAKVPARTKAEKEAKLKEEIDNLKKRYDLVIARIDSQERILNLTDEEIESIREVGKLDEPIFLVVMNRAMTLASGDGNIPRLASQIPVAFEDYNDAVCEEEVEVNNCFIPRSINWFCSFRADRDLDDFLNEDGHGTIDQETGIKIVNCSNPYLGEDYTSILEWIEDEDNIFMGKKESLVAKTATGSHAWPNQDSEWYIPLPNKSISRIHHNEIVVRETMAKIQRGEIPKEKYLALKGKTFGCTCLPYPCHCQAILQIVKLVSKDSQETE